MTLDEFKTLTGMEVEAGEFAVIHHLYIEDENEDKVSFCDRYKRSKTLQVMAKMTGTLLDGAADEFCKREEELMTELQEANNKIKRLEEELFRTKVKAQRSQKALDSIADELEWANN